MDRKQYLILQTRDRIRYGYKNKLEESNEIKEQIINTYEEAKPANKQKMLNYFIQYKLTNLMDVIEDF